MTIDVQLSEVLPATLHDWEQVLTQALLHASGGDSDAIRSFEITPETLAMYCGLGTEYAIQAEAAFKRALRADVNLMWCLQRGTYRAPTNEQSNRMAMLALSLLVDSLLDGIYEEKGQYRAKLSEWLGIDRSFMDLRGIATMWKELVAWLDERVAAGAPFRRLILPTIPVSWTHIGYTRYLSFPTKRDIRLLTKQIGRNSGAGTDPASLVLQLDPVIRSSVASYGLKAAFEDFRTALRSGAASVDHRFWRLVMRAREQAGHAAPAISSLVMEFDEYGGRRFRVGRAVGAKALLTSLGCAVVSSTVAESSNLGASIRRGVLFFRSTGLASWTAAGEPPAGNGPFHLAIASRHVRLASGAVADFAASGSWSMTVEPISAGTVNDVLRRIGISNASQTVRTIGLVDGVHVGAMWLGQPRYLPYLEGASSKVEIKPLEGGCPDRLQWSNGDLRADSPVDGKFLISDVGAQWSRRASFSALAEVHADLDAAAYSVPEQTEWRLEGTKTCDRAQAVALNWDGELYAYQDVIEAIYASSRSGVAEGDAISIIGRAAGRRSWDMLRSLQEASVLEARPRVRWRGRILTLGRPRLLPIRIGATAAVLVSGAIPSRLEADFRATVTLHGGQAVRRVSKGCMSAPLLAATGVEPEDLSAALGWPIATVPAQPEGLPVRRLIETKVSGDGYQPSSYWDWSLGRFRSGAGADGTVSLVRYVHPGGRDHDVYRVQGRTSRSFHSRQAAIIDAHVQAGRPLFRYEEGRIARLAVEGALPLEIAAALRVRTLSNAVCDDKGWSYATSAEDAAWLAALLPGLIEGVEREDAGHGAAMSYLRGRGNRRPLWRDGGIVA
ncbi:hypothetical protein J2X73_004582 [Novosphingobium sp. 1748]|uniref:hypothetical protein n=1 Tax=Novosphingobium sp. 1748 TaxID=2817760 RepID=UPI002864201F|nr:hypothetical protein [Novosphingobium sp. 1748]MDR6710177.1 hypothetical protein [Novosphingobium sp. 1748]